MKMGTGKYELSFMMGFTPEIIRSVHMRYYQLANEMAYKSINSQFRADLVTYCLGTVMFSYTAIDSFIHNQTIVNNDLKKIIGNFSEVERKKFYKNSLIDRIERLYNETHDDDLERGSEPIQSLNYLTELRIYATHYKPFPESPGKEWDKKIDNIVNNPNRKFDLAECEDHFLNKVYSADCAKWSFLFIEEMMNWVCEKFNIEKPAFKRRYDLD